MRKSVCILFAIVMGITIPCQAKGFWDTGFGRFLRGAAEQLCVAGTNHLVDNYVPEESRRQLKEINNAIYNEFGFSSENVRKGNQWTEASNEFDRQNIVKDAVFDLAGSLLGQEEVVEKMRQVTEAQLTYLSKRTQAVSEEEKQQALSERNQAYFNIGYDTYHEAKAKRTRYLAQKLKVSQKLQQNGYDPSLAEEVASSIIAIQKSDIPQDEKISLLKQYGYLDHEEVQMAVDDVVNRLEIEIEEEFRKQEELARLEEEKRLEEERIKAAELRSKAIAIVESTKIKEYVFDSVELSSAQCEELDSIAIVLNQYPELKLTVIGHTCKIGYKNINYKKGLKRAESAMMYLVSKGVAKERILCESKGELQPIANNNTKEGRKENRRIEFFISE